MSREKLYLVRKGMQEFLGPMNLSDFKRKLSKLEFGTEDEVCCSCGKWTTLEDIIKLERRYPEVYEVIKNERTNEWALGTMEPTLIHGKTKKKSNLFLIALLVLMVSGVAMFVVNKNSVKNFMAASGAFEVATSLYTSGQKAAFAEFMKNNSVNVFESLKQKKQYHQWKPFIRAYAYIEDGEFPIVPSSYIKGGRNADTPDDCSVRNLKAVFYSNVGQIENYLRGKEFLENDWTRIISWDPSYIRNRSNNHEWIEPRSYYHFCLNMAKRVIEEVQSERQFSLSYLNDLSKRFDSIMMFLSGSDYSNYQDRVVDVIQSQYPVLRVLMCQDLMIFTSEPQSSCSSNSQTGIISDSLGHGLDQRGDVISLYVSIKNEADSKVVKKNINSVTPFNSHSKFNYQAELNFYSKYVEFGGDLLKANEGTQKSFPEFNFQ
jgi:hypothetical protein